MGAPIRRVWLQTSVKLPLAAWIGAVAVMLGPFYVFPSGGPQPADALFVLAMGVLALGHGKTFRWRREATPFLALGVALVIWVTVVNTAWTGITGALTVSKSSLFYLYNIAVMASMVLLYSAAGEQCLKGFAWVVGAALLLQVVLSPIGMNFGHLRQNLFYNNPNQLGLYALLSGSVIYAASMRWTIRPRWVVLSLMCVVYLVLLTTSRGAMLGCVVLLLLFSVRHPRQAIPLLVAVGLAYLVFALIGSDVDATMNRFSDMDPGRGARGYDRMLNQPHYYFLGAGEGDPHRFGSILEGELHSSWGTLLFSYGLVGFGLYLGMIYQIVRFGGWRWLLPLAPVSIYGLSHQGFRFTQYWLLVAFMFCIVLEQWRSKQGVKGSNQNKLAPF
ncbi:MAG TPA: hypothetical protein EYO58_09320 [Flavobacteriales bacterium]|nr:hypothetical protein [Flavobacteriales bacterium]